MTRLGRKKHRNQRVAWEDVSLTSLLGVWVDPDLGLGQALHLSLVPPPPGGHSSPQSGTSGSLLPGG